MTLTPERVKELREGWQRQYDYDTSNREVRNDAAEHIALCDHYLSTQAWLTQPQRETAITNQFFRVEVRDHAGLIVAIEPSMLCGRDICDDERSKIETAIEHLRGFIGQRQERT